MMDTRDWIGLVVVALFVVIPLTVAWLSGELK